VYVPLAQAPAAMMMLAARTDVRPENLTTAVRAAIQTIDPEQPVYHVKTMARLVGDSMLPRSTSAALMTIFGGLAVLLAAVGIYGVVSYSVSQQTREFGLRLALGATPRTLIRLVAARGLTMVGAGLTLGAVASLAASRLLAGALFGIGPADPPTYAGALIVLGAVGLAACVIPAWRASRVEPLAALRVN
jgi:putative ABC transport system permease protein